jgi:hypothetical protein
MEEVDAITEQILKLQGRSSIEWDYEPCVATAAQVSSALAA